jgi:hypothetical protein
VKQSKAEKIHDRRASDLPINASVSITIVQDPYSQNGEQIEVLRSIRDDQLAGMYSRSQIDDAQYRAGRKWQQLYELSEIGAVRAIDPSKEAVDGGGMLEPLTDKQIDAFKAMGECNRVLGEGGGSLVRDVLGRGWSIGMAAQLREYYSEREISYVGHRFRICLESMAILWGYAQRKYHR